jgi:hypothetical protein
MRMCMCVCVCVCVHVYVWVCRCRCVCLNLYANLYVFVGMCMCVYLLVCEDIFGILFSRMHTFMMHAYVHSHIIHASMCFSGFDENTRKEGHEFRLWLDVGIFTSTQRSREPISSRNCLVHACITCLRGLCMRASRVCVAYACVHHVSAWLMHACITCLRGLLHSPLSHAAWSNTWSNSCGQTTMHEMCVDVCTHTCTLMQTPMSHLEIVCEYVVLFRWKLQRRQVESKLRIMHVYVWMLPSK